MPQDRSPRRPEAAPLARFAFETQIIHWRGPAPFFYAPLPPGPAAEVRAVAKAATYGWGVIPVEATINGVTFATSLFPKGETYLLPLKLAVRQRIGVTAGDAVAVDLTVQLTRTSAGSGL